MGACDEGGPWKQQLLHADGRNRAPGLGSPLHDTPRPIFPPKDVPLPWPRAPPLVALPPTAAWPAVAAAAAGPARPAAAPAAAAQPGRLPGCPGRGRTLAHLQREGHRRRGLTAWEACVACRHPEQPRSVTAGSGALDPMSAHKPAAPLWQRDPGRPSLPGPPCSAPCGSGMGGNAPGDSAGMPERGGRLRRSPSGESDCCRSACRERSAGPGCQHRGTLPAES